MLKTTTLVLLFSTVVVHASWVVQTSCNATHPISGAWAFVENGNCIKYGEYYNLITCDAVNKAYHHFLCHDPFCSDCLAPKTQPIGQCDKSGLTNMCFTQFGSINYDKILSGIGVLGTDYYAEIDTDPTVQNCQGPPHSMRIERPFTCVTTGSVYPHSTTCNSDGTFQRAEWEQTDKSCTTFPIKVETGKTGECNPPSIIRGCGLPLIGQK